MKLSKLSIVLFAALSFGAINAMAANHEPKNNAIGIVENTMYDDDSFRHPPQGVIVGKDSIGFGHGTDYGQIIIGNNSIQGGRDQAILLGSNSLNMGDTAILIGSNSSIGSYVRMKSGGKVIAGTQLIPPKDGQPEDMENWKFDAPIEAIVLGNRTRVNNQSDFLSLGNENSINGDQSVAVGNITKVNSKATSLGYMANAQTSHSIALGHKSLANREANTYGYNPATDTYYTLDDYSEEIDANTLNTLKKLDNRRIALEKALVEPKQKYDQYINEEKQLNRKLSENIFENEEERMELYYKRKALQDEGFDIYNDYVASKEKRDLKKVNEKLASEADGATLAIKANQGAVSIGSEKEKTRQLINLAAGSADTDAVNVKQLKDMRKYANDRITAVERGLAAQNSRLNKMDKKLERGLAANAALAGLMQPYNVKKFNITVGLGGYRSATAIAAGAGYRFSNNAAVKAGIATNTANFDDLSYNVSTAFEF